MGKEKSGGIRTFMDNAAAFKALYDVVARLRGPGGCPWDIEQTPESLRGDLIEETYECIEAIDEKDSAHIKEELGDIFLLATMLAYMHEQENIFSVSDALVNVSEKLIRRHPHVFGDAKFNNSAEVLDNWAKIKVEQEGRKPKDSILDEVKQGLPPLERAFKLQKKAAKVGFDWPDSEGVGSKIIEELGEVQAAIAAKQLNSSVSDKEILAAKLEEELGDLLFSVVNLCRFHNIEPSIALRRTNSKFIERFKFVEKQMKINGQEMKKENLDLMESFWIQAKNQVKP